jgi:hypothetical protein
MSRLLFILGSLLLVLAIILGLLGLAGPIVHALHAEDAGLSEAVGPMFGVIGTVVLLVGLGVILLLLSRSVRQPAPTPAVPSADRLQAVEDILAEHRAERYDAVAHRLRELDDVLAEVGEYLAAHPAEQSSRPNRQALEDLFDRARAVRELYP